MLCFLLFYLGFNCILANLNITVDYYKKLIKYETTRASTYQLPTENIEFKKAYKSDQPTEEIGSYDFVIVGAGAGGSVVATRLSEISDFKILLIEAGGEENDFSKIPGMCFYNQFNEFNWGYYTTPQKYSCLGMKNQKCMVVRGKAIGGSSAINGALYSRGNKNDFDNWAKLGNVAWSYKNVLPYFKLSENSQTNSKSKFRGVNGFWNVEYLEPDSELSNIFFEANSKMNVPYIHDYNEASQLGTSKVQLFVKRGQRQSTGVAYLANARHRSNLKIIKKALVIKIIIENKEAKGVEFLSLTKKYRVFAKKEVILSANVFNTPQLLMLSGIGPKEELEKHKINVIKNLPVGKQLFNHPVFQGLVFNSNYTRNVETIDQQIEDYLKGKGILSFGYNGQGIDFVRFGNTLPKNSPSVEDTLNPADTINAKLASRMYNYNEKTLKFLEQKNSKSGFTILIVLLQVFSQGQITLKSNSPIDFPNIDANMLSNKNDVEVVITGIKRILKLIKTKPFQEINTTLLEYNICQNFKKFSKSFWKCVIQHLSTGTDHFCGSTPMGPNPSDGSVVDENLLVHGIKNLRIVDTGVFPALPTAHSTAVIIMVAEKISDVIKKFYGKI